MNGQADYRHRKKDKRDNANQSEYLELVRGEGESTGLVSNCASREDSPGRDSFGGYDFDPDSSLGKILQRLEYVEAAHEDYVGSHQSRLEARLDESRHKQAAFRAQVESLRQEIFQLAREQQETEHREASN